MWWLLTEILLQPLLRFEIFIPAVVVLQVFGRLLDYLLRRGLYWFVLRKRSSLKFGSIGWSSHPGKRIIQTFVVTCWLFVLKRLLLAELVNPLSIRVVELCLIDEAGIQFELVVFQRLEKSVSA